MAHDGSGWDQYVEAFHRDRPGITEQVLGAARHGGRDPYGWLIEPLRTVRGPVLDLACGSGPVAPLVPSWVGVDRSEPELRAARAAGRGPLALAAAQSLPFPSRVFDAAVAAMSLQVLVPLSPAASELARVVRPGGTILALLPARGPLPWRDVPLYLALQVALGQTISYPNQRALRGHELSALLNRYRLDLLDDQQAAFALPLTTAEEADRLVGSLYLPSGPPARLESARRVVRRRVGRTITIPLRRIVIRRRAEGS